MMSRRAFDERKIVSICPENAACRQNDHNVSIDANQELQHLLDLLETTQELCFSWLLRNDVSISESLGVNPCTVPLLI